MIADARRLADTLVSDLAQIFGSRLHTVVMFGAHVQDPTHDTSTREDETVHTLALVTDLSIADLDACATRHRVWIRRGLATPLLLPKDDFARALDAFPIEFGAILARHVVITGEDPFTGLHVNLADLRRACEVQARSHVLHLREGYIEAGGDPSAIGRLVVDSVPALNALLVNLVRLGDGRAADHSAARQDRGSASLARRAADLTGAPESVIADVLALESTTIPTTDGARLFGPYLAAAERLVVAIDRWRPV
jgi:hypothetical protein